MAETQSIGAADAKPARRGERFIVRTLAGLVLAASSGALATLAFPPFDLWPLIFVAFVPMAVAQHRVMPRALAPLAPGAGIAVYYAGQLSAGLADGDVVWYIQLWPLYVGLFVAALCWPGRHFHERTGYRWIAVSFPLAWTAIDAARMLSGVDVLAGTWGNPAYALYELPHLLQPLALIGIFGLEFLLLVINFAIAGLLIAALSRDGARVRWAGGAAAITAAFAIGWGAVSMAMFTPQQGGLRVAPVMSNSRIETEADFQNLFTVTREAAQQGAQVVVWHEGALRFDPLVERTEELRALARETGAYLAIGYRLIEESGLARNEAVVFAPDGRTFGPYGKSHPGRFAGDLSDTGGEYKVYDTTLGRIATIICYDLDFTDSAREMARRGAQFIAVPSNDVPAIAGTHYTHLVFRAIENRLPMAKADSFFDTAIIDAWGRILAREVNLLTREQAAARDTATDIAPTAIIADVPLGGAGTFYTRFGDWFGWLVMAGAALGFLAGAMISFRKARP
ncbi:MAG: apolipoprotein N-acyltransferase [Hyphomonadaceae bacterium]|nr:apolipoprotein N-acyltransferase [Hyphomonadaceae bacterium]MBX3511663.1 apolipoprotein N-acyltransferase [Hyphomonadaceae bacterium]